MSWTEGSEALAEKSPDVPSETIHWFVVAPVKPTLLTGGLEET